MGSSDRLFRQEAVDHVFARDYGRVLLARPLGGVVLSLFFFGLALSVLLFIFLFSYTRKANVSGVLVSNPGLVRIQPGQAGMVGAIRVSEGQRVAAGDVLFDITSDQHTQSSGDIGRSIAGLLRERIDSLSDETNRLSGQTVQRELALERRKTELDREYERVREQINLQARRVQLSGEVVRRHEELKDANYISAAHVEEKQAALIDQQHRLTELQRASGANRQAHASTEADLQEIKIESVRLTGERRRAEFELRQQLAINEARTKIQIRAPHAGVVTGLNLTTGQLVGSFQTLGFLMPAGATLEAELYAPSRAAGFIKPGMDVLLRLQAFPFAKFGQEKGQIVDISRTVLTPEEIAANSGGVKGNEPVYRIRVRLEKQSIQVYGTERSLQVGAAVDASVLLDKRRLYEWLIEPIYAISGRL